MLGLLDIHMHIMAIPSFGGMCVVLISIFMVPVLYSLVEEWKLKRIGTG